MDAQARTLAAIARMTESMIDVLRGGPGLAPQELLDLVADVRAGIDAGLVELEANAGKMTPEQQAAAIEAAVTVKASLEETVQQIVATVPGLDMPAPTDSVN